MLDPSLFSFFPVSLLCRRVGGEVIRLEVKLSALKRTRRPYNIVVFFSECIVWLTGSLGPICCFFGFYWFFGSSLHWSEEDRVVLIR